MLLAERTASGCIKLSSYSDSLWCGCDYDQHHAHWLIGGNCVSKHYLGGAQQRDTVQDDRHRDYIWKGVSSARARAVEVVGS